MVSSGLNDDEFVRAFESCELSPDLFHHRDHIRLARIYLDRLGAAAAIERFRAAIIRFAAHNGVSDKYHETITIAWMRLVIAAAEVDGEKLFRQKIHRDVLFAGAAGDRSRPNRALSSRIARASLDRGRCALSYGRASLAAVNTEGRQGGATVRERAPK